MATRRSAATSVPVALNDPIVISDDSQNTTLSFDCTSSHLNSTQESDNSFAESQPDPSQPLDYQGPTAGEDLQALLDDPASADIDMEDHERRRQSSAPSAADDGAADSEDAEDEDEDDDHEPPANEVLYPRVVYRTTNPKHPTINFSEIRECALAGKDSIGSNTVRYELDSSFNPSNVKNIIDLRGIFRKRWLKLGGTRPLSVLPLPAAGRARHVLVVFPTTEDFAYAKDLVIFWKKKGYAPAAFGPPLGARYLIITTQVPPTASIDDAGDALYSAIPVSQSTSNSSPSGASFRGLKPPRLG